MADLAWIHTPGPWLAKEGMVYAEDTGDTIATTGGNVDGAPKANARLIASAPALLEALEAIIEFWDTPGERHDGPAVMQRARAAISQARGEE